MNLTAKQIGSKIFLIFFLWCALATAIPGNTEISVMTYNVENLFDSIDDPQTEDETYLPKIQKNSKDHKDKCKKIKNFKFRKDCFQLDWDSETIRNKMSNLSKVVLSVDKGKGPDILILVEVENKSVLDQFNRDYLAPANYKTVALLDGPDPRGIDVAILSRFPSVAKETLYPLNITDRNEDRKVRTRGVLKVPLRLSKSSGLSVFAVHLPSQASSTEVRSQALQQLRDLLKKETQPWLVGGDFNITQKEDRQFGLIDRYLSDVAHVAHRLGCGSCQGTHFYKGKWSFLDMLFLDKTYLSVIESSVDVIGKTNKPKRFIPDKGQGTSDHFPFYARFKVGK